MDFSRAEVELRPTGHHDLVFVLELERHPDNTPFIGSWSEEEHAAAISRTDREHWMIEVGVPRQRAGYLIAYDLRAAGFGVYVKRIVVSDKSRGVGRVALGRFVAHAFTELSAPFVWLSVYADNTRAQRCYSALGFRTRSLSGAEHAAHHAAVGGFSERGVLMFLRPGRSADRRAR